MVDPEVVRSELKEAFKTFDKSKRGYLDLQQMTKALGCLGEPLSDLEIKQLIKIADKNNDGKIDVDGKYCYSVIVTDSVLSFSSSQPPQYGRNIVDIQRILHTHGTFSQCFKCK